MSKLNNFLTSGHIFDEDEYELKTKFVLLNTVISISSFLVVTVTFLQMANQYSSKMYLFIFNVIYLFSAFSALLLLRINKDKLSITVKLLVATATVTLVATILHYPQEYMRMGWFLILLVFTFFLDGKQSGYAVALGVIVILVGLFALSGVAINAHIFFLMIGYVILFTILIHMYEARNDGIQKKLEEANSGLEERVAAETQKLLAQKDAYRQLAYYDPLTGLPNRTLFLDRLNNALAKSKRNKSMLALLFIDVDHFKTINDLYGHNVGDDVLKAISQRFKRHLRDSDTLARLGGDEFVLMLEGILDPSLPGTVATKIRKIASELMWAGGHEMHITVSIGISLYPRDSMDADTLLKCADTAMYSAKHDGRNASHFYKTEMTEKLMAHLNMETDIRRGITNNEFVVYYQPITDTASDQWIGLEALIRWEHPARGIVSPAAFIPVAESSSLIISLGGFVLQQVAHDLIVWHRHGFDPRRISVNLSVKQLAYRKLVPILKRILARVDFRSDWLELEITESYTFQEPDAAIALLHRIRDLGIQLAIDDFGTGYSSLSYLKKLPVEKLKIDKSFVDDVPGDPDDEALVHTIVAMGKSLNLSVVAEGIETDRQRAFLEAHGCRLMQGYLFDRPMPSSDVLRLANTTKKDENGS